MIKTLILSSILSILYLQSASQPYFDTHVKNPYVAANTFIGSTPDTTALPVFSAVRSMLPQPEWSARPDVISCYWKAWELAFGNLHKPAPGSGFVSPFIDPAFNGHIFMWDSHFMLMFGRYGLHAFNFQRTLDNFYARQHKDGFICREIVETDGSDFFERFDVSSTGPNVFPWTEWEYYLNFGDNERLSRVFDPLLAYYQWFNSYRSWPDGSYFSSGWGCGMDNQPRLPAGYSPEWSHGRMSWIDISLQQVLAGNILIRMAETLHREADVTAIRQEMLNLGKLVNEKMWDDKSSFYYDRFADGSLSSVKSIASYWALLAGVVPADRLNGFVGHLSNPATFGRQHMVPSLSADNPSFDPNGGYWKGAIWAPTNYMVLRGLTNYRLDSLAFKIASNHLDQVVKVFTQTGTLFENYAPDKIQGNDHRDFVGWTGITPISVLLEYVFGIRPDVPSNSILLDVRLTDAYGVSNYPFGKDGMVQFKVEARKKSTDPPVVKVKSTVPFELTIRWQGGSRIAQIKP